MKQLKKQCLLLFVMMATVLGAHAQNEGAAQYLDEIGKANEKLTTMYLSYLSAVGHNKSARKVDKRRQELINAIFNARLEVQGMRPFKGDRSYKDTTVAYLKMLYNVFNEDYAKIVNMEEIAEQSYDAMEAYMMAQEQANEKLNEAADRQRRMQKAFAAKYDIKLIESTSELEAKSRQATELMNHYSDVYLIFFKAYKQEAYLMDALAAKNLTAIEQNRNALLNFAEEGLKKLHGLRGYNNDASLIVACRDALNFYKDEAQKMNYATDFLLRQEAFDKARKAFDTKPAAQRTQKDVAEINKGVNEINHAVNKYNNANNQLNRERQQALANWNNTVKNYLDHYMPHQR